MKYARNYVINKDERDREKRVKKRGIDRESELKVTYETSERKKIERKIVNGRGIERERKGERESKGEG